MRSMLHLLLIAWLPVCVKALDNGLALTPPMGWLTWERFRCKTDCVNDPYNCISENLIKEMADAMASEGYKDAGYEYVIIDDCWLDRNRTGDGKLRPDPKRFPSGIKKLADYVHSKGLKFGIYEDFGSKTCAGYPGSEYFIQEDAQTFAEWGVDYLKFDGCFSNVDDMPVGYTAMRDALNKTGRPIVYSCEWPLYQILSGKKPDYAAIRNTCNLWRNHGDIQDSWDSMIGAVEFYANDSGNFSQYAGPGGWNDPDMLIIGDFGLSYDQERVQMALWCIMASPLIMSNDLRRMRNTSKSLLQNKNLIWINQDPLGKQGTVVKRQGSVTVWKKPLSGGITAVALLNTGNGGTPTKFTLTFASIGLKNFMGYNISDAFTTQYVGYAKPNQEVVYFINPSGVQMVLAIPVIKARRNEFHVV